MAGLPPYPQRRFAPRERTDARDVKAGYTVSDLNGYYDSQNIIAAYDPVVGQTVISLVLHHSHNHEGGSGLGLFHTFSTDYGKTWTQLTPIEDPQVQQSHDGYQVLVPSDTPGGRPIIALIYGWNKGSQPPGGGIEYPRTDMQLDDGFWIKWSLDCGRSFELERVVIPVPRTRIDHHNPWKGDTMGAFACDKPVLLEPSGDLYFAFQKTRDGNGESYGSEAFVLHCPGFVEQLQSTIKGPHPLASLGWQLLPTADPQGRGLYTPLGLQLGEEPHVVPLPSGRLLVLWRTELGVLDHTVIESTPEKMPRGRGIEPLRYGATQGGDGVEEYRGRNVAEGQKDTCHVDDYRNALEEYLASSSRSALVAADHSVMRNPRGAITPIVMQSNGHVVLLYYNNGHTERFGYTGRLVLWLTMGRLTGEGIEWSQPELALWWDGLLLDDREDWNEDWAIVDGCGYADFQEVEGGNLVVVASNKICVRYHEVPSRIVRALERQVGSMARTRQGGGGTFEHAHPVFRGRGGGPLVSLRASVLPDLRSRQGFTLRLTFCPGQEKEDVVLVNALSTVSKALDEPQEGGGAQAEAGFISKGYEIRFCAAAGCLTLRVTDGFAQNFEHSITLPSDSRNAAYYRLDGPPTNPVSVAWVLDGGPKLCLAVVNDKLWNPHPQGWKFMPPQLGEISGCEVRLANNDVGLEVYDEALLVTECAEIWRQQAGRAAASQAGGSSLRRQASERRERVHV
eukprot:Hpha_TRINITY_DN12585_c0_g1::TRINITY_DN12585_c0_g1_i1::g.50806::m.50806